MRFLATLGAAALLVSTGASAQSTASDEAIMGVWANPSGSVHVRIGECDDRLCGVVVYADDKAKADAAEAGTDDLVGTNLFRGLSAHSDGSWHGDVLVPSLDRTVSGELKPLDADTLEVQGCMFGHIACRDQRWTRVGS